MPLIQAYRQAYPQASDDDFQRLIACDAFMRRAAPRKCRIRLSSKAATSPANISQTPRNACLPI